jgi:hypothetical protein
MQTNTYPAEVKRCYYPNFPGAILHELSHSTAVYKPSTNDYATGDGCKKLTEARGLNNADSYNMYAQSIYLGRVC